MRKRTPFKTYKNFPVADRHIKAAEDTLAYLKDRQDDFVAIHEFAYMLETNVISELAEGTKEREDFMILVNKMYDVEELDVLGILIDDFENYIARYTT